MRRHQRTDRERVLDDRQHPTGLTAPELEFDPNRTQITGLPGPRRHDDQRWRIGCAHASHLLTDVDRSGHNVSAHLFAHGADNVNVPAHSRSMIRAPCSMRRRCKNSRMIVAAITDTARKVRH
jgi:hypothetical protein